jgi:plasmid stabilization system protein ParE
LASEVEDDFQRLADFLSDKNPRAAVRAMRALRAAAQSLSDFAERGRRGQLTDERELVVRVGGGPYVIAYRVRPTTVLVMHIWHAKEERRGVAP